MIDGSHAEYDCAADFVIVMMARRYIGCNVVMERLRNKAKGLVGRWTDFLTF